MTLTPDPMTWKAHLTVLVLACCVVCAYSEDHQLLRALDSHEDLHQDLRDDLHQDFLRPTRQFYRFGRAFGPLWADEEAALLQRPSLAQWPGYPVNQALADDSFVRHGRQFYRFGRAYPPYQDKRFLRFGRSKQPSHNEYDQAVFYPADEVLTRKRRSHSVYGPLVLNGKTDSLTDDPAQLVTSEGRLGEVDQDTGKQQNQSLRYTETHAADEELAKRFMRFGKRFMRFGRGNFDNKFADKKFMRFGKRFGNEQDAVKRFMRFGKRFMRFGKGQGSSSDVTKRFMSFGKSNSLQEPDKYLLYPNPVGGWENIWKRFMRFGRADQQELLQPDLEKRFMRFGRGVLEEESGQTGSSANVVGPLERYSKRSVATSDGHRHAAAAAAALAER